MLAEQSLNILVVEDDPLANQLIGKQLELVGHKVAGRAFDANQAVEMTKELRPDLVLMDMQMQESNSGETNMDAGTRATQLIQEECPTPVIILTAHENPFLIRKAKAVGAGAYLLKPPKIEEIERAAVIAIARFNDLMETRRLNKSLQEEIELRKQTESELKYLATHDALTGLPDRLLLEDRFEVESAHSKRNQKLLGLMLLGLNPLNDVAYTPRFQPGDKLIQIVSQRLSQILRESDTVVRMGNDEFMILLPEMAQIESASETAQRILKVLKKPFILSSFEFQLAINIGITQYPNDGEDLETLVKNARVAMHRAKDTGRNRYQYYRDEVMGSERAGIRKTGNRVSGY